MALFTNPRRVVTGHDETGAAIYVDDREVEPVSIAETIDFSVLYEVHELPVSNDRWQDPILQPTEHLVNKSGIVLRIVDLKPGNEVVFHRTESLDFGIMIAGEIVCRLDNQVEKIVRAGDTVIQRGTIHSWENRAEQPARIAFVMIAAHPVQVGGKVLGTSGFNNKEIEVEGDIL